MTDINLNRQIAIQRQYGILLDGSSQNWQKLTPTGVDLKSSTELITSSDDRDFEVTKGHWADNGNHVAVRSTVQKHGGVASLLITSIGAGDATTNFESLPFANFTTLTVGLQYIVSFYARAITNPIKLSAQIGDKVIQSGVISTSNFNTRYSFTFTAGASTASQDIKLFTDVAGSVYVDDISLVQSYDALVVVPFRTSTLNGGTLFDLGVVSTTTTRILISVAFGTGYISATISGVGAASNTTITGSVSTSDGIAHIAILKLDRSGNAELFLDGVSIGTGAINDKNLSGFDALTIGYKSPTGSSVIRFTGSIFQTQYIIFQNNLPSDINNTIASISQNWIKKGLPKFYKTGIIVADYNWRNNGRDSSGSTNHLTAVGQPLILRM